MTTPQPQNTPTANQNRIVTQWLMDFTVQIRHPDNATIVGTGIVVSMQGHVVTCARVLHIAGIPEPGLDTVATVTVYFPQVRSGEPKAYPATVVGSFPDYEDDVVLLQLQSQTTPLGPEQIAVLGRADF